MAIKYPSGCTTNSSRRVFCEELIEQLRLWHNVQCAGKTAEEARKFRAGSYKVKEKAVFLEMFTLERDILSTSFWKPKATDVGAIKVAYPVGLDKNSEASKYAFTFELAEILVKAGNAETKEHHVLLQELGDLKEATVSKKYWDADSTDIDGIT